jgi:phosphatidylinositol alpha-mannosyltransferase
VLSEKGLTYAKKFDWESVSQQILDVYEVAIAGGTGVTLASENRGWRRLRNE